jgi:hypothetical protein
MCVVNAGPELQKLITRALILAYKSPKIAEVMYALTACAGLIGRMADLRSPSEWRECQNVTSSEFLGGNPYQETKT